MNTNPDYSIYEFEEKPKEPKSTLASMGIYIFKWDLFTQYLIEEEKDPNSSNDIGKNIIANLLNDHKKLMAYPLIGYWKDVGTIESFWHDHMELFKPDNELNIFDKNWKINTRQGVYPPLYVSDDAKVISSLVDKGCEIEGEVRNSVIFPGVKIGKNSKVINSVVMQNTVIEETLLLTKLLLLMM